MNSDKTLNNPRSSKRVNLRKITKIEHLFYCIDIYLSKLID